MTFLPILLASTVLAGASAPQRAPEKGLASWYGKAHHGRLTASGERFDMHAMTAAHRTLPFGTVVRVTNLKSGKSVKVRINDRGPFRRDRIIDLSYEAAKKLGFVRRGAVRVKITVIDRG